MLCIHLNINAQSRYHYIIKIKDVNDLPSAKESTDWLRSIAKVYPTFNDTTNNFDFYSTENLTYVDVVTKAVENGYTVLYFNKINAVVVVYRKELEDEE